MNLKNIMVVLTNVMELLKIQMSMLKMVFEYAENGDLHNNNNLSKILWKKVKYKI